MKACAQGVFYTIASAVIFGFTPILVRTAYDGGANGITMAFLRALLALPALAFLVRRHGETLVLAPGHLRKICWLGVLGTSGSTLLLYASYAYISVGTATTLHFIYPLLVNLGCALFFKEHLNRFKVTALVLGTLGISMFVDFRQSGFLGLALALLSGAFYAFYIIYMSVSGLKHLYYFKLSFYLCVTLAATSGLFGLFTQQLVLQLTPKAWLCAVLVSLCVSVGSVSLLQLGIRLTGAGTSSILSTLEPITSVLLGVLLLREEISAIKILGCGCILVSVALIAFAQSKRAHKNAPQKPQAVRFAFSIKDKNL